MQQNIVILRNRLNSPELAVSEPQVAREGVDRIAIQLPGLQNSAEVKKILGKTATLEFRMVDENDNPLEAASTGHVPLGAKLYYTRDKQPVLLKRDVVVTGDQLTDASFHGSHAPPRVPEPGGVFLPAAPGLRLANHGAWGRRAVLAYSSTVCSRRSLAAHHVQLRPPGHFGNPFRVAVPVVPRRLS